MISNAKTFEPLDHALPVYAAGGGDEDGYDLWLRYRPLPPAASRALRARARSLVLPARPSLTLLAAAAELVRGVRGLAGAEPRIARSPGAGAIVLATPKSMPKVQSLGLGLEALGPEGYVVRAMRLAGKEVTLIAANTDVGVLYG